MVAAPPPIPEPETATPADHARWDLVNARLAVRRATRDLDDARKLRYTAVCKGREAGLSFAKIGVLLGVTDNAIIKILRDGAE